MRPSEVIKYLESHPLDEAFVKILQRDYEFDVYDSRRRMHWKDARLKDIDSFLFYHYGQMASGGTIDEKVEYPSPATPTPAELQRAPNRTATGRLDTSEVFRRRFGGRDGGSATIETYFDPDGERGLRFKYYWITLIGEDYDDVYDTENPLEDYFSDPSVREEYRFVDECWGEYEFSQFDLPYRFRSSVLNYPKGFM